MRPGTARAEWARDAAQRPWHWQLATPQRSEPAGLGYIPLCNETFKQMTLAAHPEIHPA